MAVYALSDAQSISYIYLCGLMGQFWFPMMELVGKARLEFGKRCSRGRVLEMGNGPSRRKSGEPLLAQLSMFQGTLGSESL